MKLSDEDIEKILALKIPEPCSTDPETVGEWIQEALANLFVEGESFRGKAPLGNSGWEIMMDEALVRGGFVKGTFITDEYETYIDEYDDDTARKIWKEVFARTRLCPTKREN